MQTHFTGENIMSVERKYIDVPLSAITASTLPINSRPAQPVQEMGTRLLELAKKGDAEGVRELMNSGAPFSTDWLGTSPLHFAAQNNHWETVEMLLKAGISRDARNKVERTPLHVAAQEGHLEIVQLLISYGADVDCRDMLKMTPLHWGAEKGHAEVVRLLLDFGADPLVLNKFDKTPYNIAHDNNRVDIMEMLQDAAALDPISRKVLKNQCLLSTGEENLQSGNQPPSQQQTTFQSTAAVLTNHSAEEISSSNNGTVLKVHKIVGRRKIILPKSQLQMLIQNQQENNQNVDDSKCSKLNNCNNTSSSSRNNNQSNNDSNNRNKTNNDSISDVIEVDALSSSNGINNDGADTKNVNIEQRKLHSLQNLRLPTETQNANNTTLQMLQEHGITMLPVDDSSIVASAVQSGQTVVLTEAGKMALNLTKLNSSTPPRSVSSGAGGVVKRIPMTTKHIKTNPTTQKILIDGRKLIRVQPEELINMTREKKVIIHTGDKRLGRPGQIIFSKPLKQVGNLTKTLGIQNKKITAHGITNGNVKATLKAEVKQERGLSDYEEITKQLEEARREAEMYKEQLMLKEKEAEQYKMQLQSLVNGK